MTDNLMTPVGGALNELQFGSVYSRSLTIFSRNIIPFGVVSAVAALPYLVMYLSPAMSAEQNTRLPATQVLSTFFLPLAIGFLLQIIAQAVLLNGAFQYMRGRQVAIGELLRIGLARFFPIIALGLLEGLALMLGFALLIIPGIILGLAWYVALPACVVEKLGPSGSLGRSWALTKGSRWRLLAVAVVLIVASSVAGGLAAAVGALAGKTGVAVAQYLVQAFFLGFQAILTTVIYHDLRVAKEGVDTETIAAVFD